MLRWLCSAVGERNHTAKTDFCTGILDKIVWIDFSDACKTHDQFYPWSTLRQKCKADRIFFWRMVKCVKRDAEHPIHGFIGVTIAFVRWCAVSIFGLVFWDRWF